MCKCSGAISSAKAQCLFGVASEDHRAEFLQALPGQLAPLKSGQLPLKLRDRGVQHTLVPADQDARPRRMFGLGDQVQCRVIGPRGAVHDHHDLAGAGDGVDIDLAVDVFLRQGDEKIARPDDFIHPPQAFDSIRQRRHALAPPTR